jgi:molybdate transport system regulatory protein
MTKARSASDAPDVRVRILSGSAIALGPGKADLLASIAQTGSISAAARQMGMSYRRAWLLVHTINECFAEPVVEAVKGGADGGGAQLTRTGREILVRYHEMVRQATTTFAPYLKDKTKRATTNRATARRRSR